MVEFYLLTFPRFPLRKKEHKSYFGKNQTHGFCTSKCAGYLLDPSGDYITVTKVYQYVCLVASEASRFGHEYAVHIGVDVRAGDVEVDVIYITFIMSVQYTESTILGTVQRQGTTGQLDN